MAARKRTDDEILRDRAEIATRYLRRETFQAIAVALTARPGIDYAITPQQVQYDMEAIRDGWRLSAQRAAAEHVAEQLAKIDQMELTAWKAWDESCKQQTVKTQYAKAGKNQQPEPTAAVVSTRQGLGDSRYLQTLQWCVQERSRLLGLYQPETRNVNIRAPGALNTQGMQPQEVRDEIRKLGQILELQEQALAASDPNIIDQDD